MRESSLEEKTGGRRVQLARLIVVLSLMFFYGLARTVARLPGRGSAPPVLSGSSAAERTGRALRASLSGSATVPGPCAVCGTAIATGAMGTTGGHGRCPRIRALLFKKKIRLRLEVVDKPDTLSRGLMFRKTLAADLGMLFVFPYRRVLSFWMRNTYIPLSIAYLDNDFRIINICYMKPLDEGPRYLSKEPCRYALEVNQGWFRLNGIKPGDRAVPLYE